MTIEFGVDSISYHTDLRRGLNHVDLVHRASQIGADWLLIDEEYAEHLTPAERADVRRAADGEGLRLLYSGRSVGGIDHDLRPRLKDLVNTWLDVADVFASPFVRVHSSWYGSSLLGDDEAFVREDEYLVDACATLSEVAHARGAWVSIENHSNLPSSRWREIVEPYFGAGLAMFIDLANGPGMFERGNVAIDTLGPISIGGHVKNFTVESKEASHDRYYRTGFEVSWSLPSVGVLQIPKLVRLLAETTHAQAHFPLLIESLFPVDSAPTLDRIYARELAFLKSIITKTGE